MTLDEILGVVGAGVGALVESGLRIARERGLDEAAYRARAVAHLHAQAAEIEAAADDLDEDVRRAREEIARAEEP